MDNWRSASYFGLHSAPAGSTFVPRERRGLFGGNRPVQAAPQAPRFRGANPRLQEERVPQHYAPYASGHNRALEPRKDRGHVQCIRIPLFWGESAILYVAPDTCWIPIKLLEKIFGCPGIILAAFCKCSSIGNKQNPLYSACYNCVRALEKHFDLLLTHETRPILNNVRKILEINFRRLNGFEIPKPSSFTCASAQTPNFWNGPTNRAHNINMSEDSSVSRSLGDEKRYRREAARIEALYSST